jgi:hypothetical protein
LGDIDGHECEIYAKTGLPLGMKDGTTPENFIVHRGGWNCGHQLVPVSEAAVPEDVRKKIEEVNRIGKSAEINAYTRVESDEKILKKLKDVDSGNILSGKINILPNQSKKMGASDGRGNISLRKDEYESFLNAVDKLMQGKGGEITATEAGATLTYWHERTHNLSKSLLSQAKFKGEQEKEMEMATEFLAIKTLPDFYKQFNAETPVKINISSNYSNMVGNYQKAVDKLVKIGGINENDVILKIKNHIINGKWENQRVGLIDALYGAKINGKIIDAQKLGYIVDYAKRCSDFQFERKMNKLLEKSD